MTLLAFGINHNTAALDVRERVAFAPEQMEEALAEVCRDAGLEEAAILSTCNRTEIYGCGDESALRIMEWLASYHRVDLTSIQACSYTYTGAEAIRHMMAVASGLDSLVLGEPQILGQMKSAYAVADKAGTVSSHLHSAFHQVFSVAKRVRTETSIGENPVSVAYAAVSLAQQIFSNLKQDTALLIGAGETIELVARHLFEQGVRKILVANRTLGRARELAEKFNAEAILLADIPAFLHQADIVISSTASQLPLLGKGAVESALKKRKHKPMFMVDIAVPRDIEAEVGDLADVYLYTVDDLREVIDENRRSRQEAAKKADEIVDQGVSTYERELRALNSVSVIRAIRSKAEQLRDQELDKALKLLANGSDPSVVMTQLARGLTNKLLHEPTIQLKQASQSGREEMMGLTRQLFNLNDQDSDPH